MFIEPDVKNIAWSNLHKMLAQCQYTTTELRRLICVAQSIDEMLGDVARLSFWHSSDPALRQTPCGVLARLFLFNCAIEAWELAMLPLPLFALLKKLNLVEYAKDGTVVRGTVSITEYRQRYFLSDMLFENFAKGFTVHDDARRCMPPHASSLELLRSLGRPPGARSFLDIGCGSGCQSIIFGEGYERVTGLDIEPRSAMFAQINAAINNSNARYHAADWEALSGDVRSDHIVFNTPNSDAAFAFVTQKVGDVLSDQGWAQIWLWVEVTSEDRDVFGVLERKLGENKSLDIHASVDRSSPFCLSRENIRERSLPRNTLLIRQSTELDAYFDRLADHGVVEIASLVLTVRHRT